MEIEDGQIWSNKKRGGKYKILGVGVECTNAQAGEVKVAYRNVEEGAWCFREIEEFKQKFDFLLQSISKKKGFEVGQLVRLTKYANEQITSIPEGRNDYREAYVIAVLSTPTLAGGCRLDRDLRGCMYWSAEDLERVPDPAQRVVTSTKEPMQYRRSDRIVAEG